jgi:LacI family transcriptional regulator
MNEVTINQVAARSGVSKRTISRVINGSAKVNARTRSHVESVIASLGYRPNTRARALSTGRSFLIGLVHDDPKALAVEAVQRGLSPLLGEHGFELVVHPCSHSAVGLLEDVRRFIDRSRVDGLVLLPPLSELAQLHDAIAATGTPSVSIASVPIEGRSMLVSMERDAVRHLTESLLALGHRRLAFVSGPSHFLSAQQRLLGFRQALAACGLEPFAIAEGDYSFESGLRCGGELLSGGMLPTAIFASNDFMAAGVLKAAAARGLSVPHALSVAGFGDSIIAPMLTPTLTTINRPMRAMAEMAGRRLLDLIDGGDLGARSATMIPLSLVERESTARAPG